MEEFGKTEVIVGVEPTGHYWLNLAYFLEEKGISLVMTNPMHVERSKELDDNLPTKRDAKDALVIAQLVKDGRFSYPRILNGIEAELRIGATVSLQTGGRTGSYSESNDSLARSIFSGVSPSLSVVWENSARSAGIYAFPSDLAGKELEEVLCPLSAKRRVKIAAKAESEKADGTSPTFHWCNRRTTDARIEIATLVRRYRQLEEEIEALTQQLIELVQTSVEYEWLKTVSD
jgi:transposase